MGWKAQPAFDTKQTHTLLGLPPFDENMMIKKIGVESQWFKEN